MTDLLKFYRYKKPPSRFSTYIQLKDKKQFFKKYIEEREHIVGINAYCLMPTHIHLILTQLDENGVSVFMKNILDSYTRYFNIRTKRKGPLWQSRFKNVMVENDEQMLHLTRYLHLNPTSGGLVERPEEWPYSSYAEFIGIEKERTCNRDMLHDILPNDYKIFVEERVEYQKEIAILKDLCLE
ncbi:MAG: transposase [Nitrospirota bacterium]